MKDSASRQRLAAEIEDAWLSEIENRNIRGKLGRSLHACCKREKKYLLESVENASLDVVHTWSTFIAKWTHAEVERIYRELQLVAYISTLQKKQMERRKREKPKLDPLEREILAYVHRAGGSVDFAPAQIARQLSKSRRSLSVTNVKKAMHRMCRQRIAEKMEVRRGMPARFTAVLRADNQTEKNPLNLR